MPPSTCCNSFKTSRRHHVPHVHVHREVLLSYSKKRNMAAAATLPMARALQRAVGSTCRRFFGGAPGLGAPPPTVKISADCEGALGGCPKTAGLKTFIFSLHVKLKCDAMMLAKQFHAFCCRIGGAPVPHHTPPQCENFG